jgi:uncharacterized protein YndB with AHSA1/START domain
MVDMTQSGVVVVDAAVSIRRSPEDVFDYCSDHRHEPEWNPKMRRIELLTEEPIGPGTRYATEFVKGPPMLMECVAFERPTRWSMTGESRLLKAVGDWQVTASEGGARLTTHAELDLRGPLKLAAPVIRRRQQKLFQRDLENIRRRLEDRPLS